MFANTIVDLAVLGIVQSGSIAAHRLAPVAKALVPDLWSPTIGVVDAAIHRNLAAGYLWRSAGKDSAERLDLERLELTATGVKQFQKLLMRDPGNLDSPAIRATEAVQFCFLDAAGPGIAEQVLLRLRGRFRQRLMDLKSRCRDCPHGGRYTNLWMAMEQRRLEAMAQMLAMVSDVGGGGSRSGLSEVAQ